MHFFGQRAATLIDFDTSGSFSSFFGENPVPMDARAARVSISIVDHGGIMYRADKLPGLCYLSPAAGQIIVELPQSTGGGRFRATCSGKSSPFHSQLASCLAACLQPSDFARSMPTLVFCSM